ncbi:MAG TPA: redoxin domain-containing protein [Chitinophagaceae bacterium]|nr:redoxin domain-containing protein [Chitinophagaceae bacterium]
MKRKHLYLFLVINIFAIVLYSSVVAQPIPPFKMLLTNGRTFYAKDLPRGRPVIIIYFSPDCEHCQTLMNAFFKKANDFKRAEIVMVTFRPLSEVAGFEKAYKISRYSNIKVGTEVPVFFFKMYFNLLKTPFTVLYNKQGQYSYSYREQTPIDDLQMRLKMLK